MRERDRLTRVACRRRIWPAPVPCTVPSRVLGAPAMVPETVMADQPLGLTRAIQRVAHRTRARSALHDRPAARRCMAWPGLYPVDRQRVDAAGANRELVQPRAPSAAALSPARPE